MMWPVLTKLEKDQVEEAIIIAPYWPTQSWFPRLMKKKTLLRYISSKVLILPGTNKAHPLSPKLKLMAVKVQRDSLILGVTRASTKVKYASIVRKWKDYCMRKQCVTDATTISYANFLTEEFDRGLK